MILDASKYDSKQDSDTHGHSAENTETAHLAERPWKADEEAYDGSDYAPYNSTCGRAVGEGIKQLRTDQAVKG